MTVAAQYRARRLKPSDKSRRYKSCGQQVRYSITAIDRRGAIHCAFHSSVAAAMRDKSRRYTPCGQQVRYSMTVLDRRGAIHCAFHSSVAATMRDKSRRYTPAGAVFNDSA